MSAFPQALLDHLQGEATTVCHCWRVTRKDGAVLGFTDHDRALVVDGVDCEPETGFSASEARDSLGLQPDTVDVEGALSSDRIGEEDIAGGLYDGARVETFLVNWRAPDQFALIRTAVIGKMTRSDGRFSAELESVMRSLDQPNGRWFRRACDAELGDARCGFDLGQPGFGGAGAVLAVEAADTLLVGGLDGFEAGWFSHGFVTWTEGESVGRRERVIAHEARANGVALVLWRDGGRPIAPGDAFTIAAGCDKRFSTCKAKFSNALNFRGFPHLPGNDAAYGYATDGQEFDGGVLVS
jgi:uncharacterized phage protein (TIGR02218 family)